MKERSHLFRRFLISVMIISFIFSGMRILMLIDDDMVVHVAEGALTSTDPIVIDGNFDLAAHSTVSSGSGTQLDPYVISDFIIDATASGRAGMAIRNTTSHLMIRNLTINVSQSAIGIILYPLYSGGWQSMNIILENITINGGASQIDMYVPIRITIKDSTFNNPSSTGDVIYARYGYFLNIFNNTFNCPNMDVDLDYTTSVGFNQNTGEFRRYEHLNFRYSNFANNTLDVYSVRMYSGYFSDFQGNIIQSRRSNDNLVYLMDCNRIKIANNTLKGGYDTIYVSHPNAYSPVRTDYPKWASLRFEYNHIDGSGNRGIFFYFTTGHARIQYVNVVFNRFTNCSSYAVSVRGGGHVSTLVWHNVFENNHGSTDIYKTSNAQAEDRYGQFSWDNTIIGNYWKDLRSPDDDNDGFVDNSVYSIFSIITTLDNYPISNPYFDFEPPELNIIRPRGRFLDNSYLNLSWKVYDNHSGVKKTEVRYGFQPWIDATERDHHGFYLTQGNYKVKIRATDNALLEFEKELDIFVNRTALPFTLSSPIDEEFYNRSLIDIYWTVENGFVPFNMSYILNDGIPVDMDPWTDFQLSLPDGDQSLELRFFDHYGNKISKTTEFIVDTEAPHLKILYPAEGSVISNGMVNFRWEQSDESGISSMFFRIDENEMEEVENSYFSELLANGPHTLTVIIFDNAGNSREESLDFVISRNTSLNIITPRFTTPVSSRTLTVMWEYLYAGLEIESISMVLNNDPPQEISPVLMQYEIILPNDGIHRITVRAFDPAGNMVSDTVEVVLDRAAPTPDFQFISDGDYLNQTNLDLKWNAVERWGIDHFELYADDELKAGNLKQGSFSLDLVPGVHELKIIAYDLAGNSGEKVITVTIDTNEPTFTIFKPEDAVFTSSYLTFEWAAVDDHGVDRFTYSIDSRPIEDLGLATSRQISLVEGFHSFVLNCYDLAGNIETTVKEFMVDLNDPEVYFTRVPESHIRVFNGIIEWEIAESVGVAAITLTIDGVDYQVSSASRYFIFDLETGSHHIAITVTDVSGREDEASFDFIIDPDPPAVKKGEKDISIDGTKALIYWKLEEDKENLIKTLTLDGNIINIDFNLDDGSFLFGELEPGNHTVILYLEDQAGNQKEIEWSFIIKEGGGGNSISAAGSTGLIIFLIILFLLILAASIGGYLYLKKKPKEEEKKMEIPKKPHKLVIGPTPAHTVTAPKHSRHHVHHRSHSIKAPPVSASAKGQKAGHGYIRPDQPKKQVSRTIVDAPPHKEHMHRPEDRRTHHHDQADDIEEWGEGEEIEDWDSMEEL